MRNMQMKWYRASAAAVHLTECFSPVCAVNKDDRHMSQCLVLNSFRRWGEAAR